MSSHPHAFSPPRFTRGRLAARVSLGYLALVLAASTFAAYDAAAVEHADASFAGIYAVGLTLPLSIPAILATDALFPPDAFAGPITGIVLVLACGVIQAAGLWFALRGRSTSPG
jgi:hypothetical protein